MFAAAPDAEALLRGAGLRATESRRAVLAALCARPHATADEVLGLVRAAGFPEANLQSVYNALADFDRAGLARKIEPAGHAARFELRVGDNHHHLVCTDCGDIQDVDCAVGHAPCLSPNDARDFELNQAEVTYWGRCPQCRSTPVGEASLAGSR